MLPRSVAPQCCSAVLPSSVAQQCCPAASPIVLCPAVLPSRVAQQCCPAVLLISVNDQLWAYAYTTSDSVRSHGTDAYTTPMPSSACATLPLHVHRQYICAPHAEVHWPLDSAQSRRASCCLVVARQPDVENLGLRIVALPLPSIPN